MSGYVWELSEAGSRCNSHQPGHPVHYIHFNVSMRNPAPVTPVTAVVDDDGLVHITGDDLSLVLWNHRPNLLRTELQRFGGMADWRPRWHLLAIPTEAIMGSARSVFYMASPGQRSECRVNRRVHSDTPPRSEARNTRPHNVDHSHIPPLRVADRYADGRRNRRTPVDRGNDAPSLAPDRLHRRHSHLSRGRSR